MADGLKMMLAMSLFFGAMYLYAISPEIIAKYKEKRLWKSKLKKEENRKKEKRSLVKFRKDRTKVIDERREKIKEHYKWLEEMNEKIKQKELFKQEHIH